MKRNARWILLALGSLASVMAVAQKGMGGNPSSQAGAQSPSYVGTIPVAENATLQAYQSLAKVTAEEAVRAAQKALGTQASPTAVKLSVENGYLVWEVVFGGQEVKVDAGNGQVLHREAAGSEEHEDKGGEHEDQGEEGGEGE